MSFFDFKYDKEKDLIIIDFSDDKMSSIKEVDNGVFVKKDIFTNKVTSIVLSGFNEKQSKKQKNKEDLDIVDLASFFSPSFKVYKIEDLLNNGKFKSNKDDFFQNLFNDSKEKNRLNTDEDDNK